MSLKQCAICGEKLVRDTINSSNQINKVGSAIVIIIVTASQFTPFSIWGIALLHVALLVFWIFMIIPYVEKYQKDTG